MHQRKEFESIVWLMLTICVLIGLYMVTSDDSDLDLRITFRCCTRLYMAALLALCYHQTN